MPLRTSCTVIGASDLLMFAALYNSHFAYRIDLKLEIIWIVSAVLLIIGAAVKNRGLLLPWYIIHSFIEIGLVLVCVLIVVGACHPSVGAHGVILIIDEIVFDQLPVKSSIDLLVVTLFGGERAAKRKILTTFLIYSATALALYFVCAYRTGAVGKYRKELKDEREAEQIQDALPTPNEPGSVYLIIAN